MIYFVEDDNSIRKLVLYSLTSAGLEAEGFARPSAFWAALDRRGPEVVLLDIMLPEEDGISILKKLREDRRTRSVQVILLTAKGSEYDKVVGLDAGADDYVSKPFGMMELMARVRSALRRAGDRTPAPSRGVRRDPHPQGVPAAGPPAGASGGGVHPGPAAQHHLGLRL